MTTYQPVWRDGGVVTRGERPSDDRYDIICEHVYDRMARPFSVFDLGAAEGYFAARTVEDYAATVTAADTNRRLRDLGSHADIDVLAERLDVKGLRALPRHDVVLALSVLHHFRNWEAAFREILACYGYAVLEVPDPAENWMRRSAARRQLRALHDLVANHPGAELVGRSKRVAPGRASPDTTYMRPIYRVPGTLLEFSGTAFSGSGSNSKSVRKFADARLTDQLGYEPYPGSLNVRGSAPDVRRVASRLGEPAFTWSRRIGQQHRAYRVWRAWVDGDLPGHVIVPTARKAHPNTLELWAPVRLRDELGIEDGDPVRVAVEVGR